VRFLGVDLAWKDGNRSGVALLSGSGFPLELREAPRTLARHRDVLTWIARRVSRHRAAIGIDAPLLGLGGGRRSGDNEISRVFGRFHASTHSPPRYPGLEDFTGALLHVYVLDSFGPGWRPGARRPTIREVYPNALQVLLFGLDEPPGLTIVKYKRQRFAGKRAWVEQGLRPFIDRCAESIGRRYVATDSPGWRALLDERPRRSMSSAELKDIEDRWDAVLCGIGAALEFFTPGSMRFYPEGPEAWRRGYILAPTLPIRRKSPSGTRLHRSSRGGQSLTDSASRPPGSMRARRSWAAQCRWGPVARPVLPTAPMITPRSTSAPSFTSTRSRCM
jgi:predicted RNase H-like nuclease